MLGRVTSWFDFGGITRGVITDAKGNPFVFNIADVEAKDKHKIKLGVVVFFDSYLVRNMVAKALSVSIAKQKCKNEFLKETGVIKKKKLENKK